MFKASKTYLRAGGGGGGGSGGGGGGGSRGGGGGAELVGLQRTAVLPGNAFDFDLASGRRTEAAGCAAPGWGWAELGWAELCCRLSCGGPELGFAGQAGFGLRAGRTQVDEIFALYVDPAVDPETNKGAVDVREFLGPGTTAKNDCRSEGTVRSG